LDKKKFDSFVVVESSLPVYRYLHSQVARFLPFLLQQEPPRRLALHFNKQLAAFSLAMVEAACSHDAQTGTFAENAQQQFVHYCLAANALRPNSR